MFKSFFPKPGTFFLSAFVWALIAVIFWQAGGGDWVARITGASGQIPISAARFWSLDFLIFKRLLHCLRRTFCIFLVYLQPAPLAILVNTRYCTDHLRHLVFGGSRGRRQRLVCTVL